MLSSIAEAIETTTLLHFCAHPKGFPAVSGCFGSRDLITGGVFKISGPTYSVVVTAFSVVVDWATKIFSPCVDPGVEAVTIFFSCSSCSSSGSK